MKKTIYKNIMSKAQRVCLCFMVLAAFGINNTNAQESQQNDSAKTATFKRNKAKHETRTVKGRVTDSATGLPMGGVRV